MKNFLLPLIFLQVVLLKAQSPDILWSRSFGNKAHDRVNGVYQLFDGGFLAAGSIQDTTTYDYDAWIFATDQLGNPLWQKEFGVDSLDEVFNCMRSAPDGGFILCGDAERTDSYIDIYAKKIDSSGNAVTSNRFGNPDNYYNGYCVDAFPNGDFIIAGRIMSTGSNFTFIRTFPDLSLMYGNVGDWEWSDIAYGVSVTYDNGYVVIGTTNSWGEHSNNIFILKMSADGYYENYNIIGSSGDQEGYWIEQTSDSCYILCGSTTYLSQDRDIYIAKVDRNLEIIWVKRYGSTSHDKGVKIIENAEGGYTCVATASNRTNFGKSSDIYVLRLDEYGDTLWTKFLGEPNRDESASSIAQTSDGGYIVSGNQLVTSTNLNAYLVRLASDPYKIDSYYRFDLNIEIPDLGVANDILTVEADNKLLKLLNDNVVSGVTVMLDSIIHPHVSDLTLLLSHEGITDTLIYQAGEEGADIINCNLSDASTTIINEGEAPFTGNLKPHNPLSVFNGVNPIGEWTLTIQDDLAGNTGTLQAWGLKLYFDKATDIINEIPKIPTEFVLHKNYPNPFNPSTTIKYSIPNVASSFSSSMNVTLIIYDILGREIATLVDKQQKPGYYEVDWNAINNSSGIYFYRIRSGSFVETKKMLLLK